MNPVGVSGRHKTRALRPVFGAFWVLSGVTGLIG